MLLALTMKEHSPAEGARVELSNEGLLLLAEDRLLSMVGGSVEYVHLKVAQQAKVLDAVSELGLQMISASVPWSIHEVEAGSYLFQGAQGRYQRDLGRFLDSCHERGLFVWLRIGPAVGLELEGLGFPRRILDEGRFQARGPQGEPVIIALPPAAFAAPSYASEGLLAEAGAWVRAVSTQIASYRYPEGPVVAVSIDDKASFFYRTAAYDQDYHPDAVEGFSTFVKARHGDTLPEVYASVITPPRKMDARSVGDLALHLDWLAYKEDILRTAIAHFVAEARAGGLEGIPLFHGAPHTEVGGAIPLTSLQQSVESASYDLFSLGQNLAQHRRALRRARANSRSTVVGQLQWGAPAWWAPPLAHAQCSAALGALMHGARGLIFHSLVERDRWVDAPISCEGRPTGVERYALTQRLIAAIADLEVLKRSEKVEVAIISEGCTRRLSLLSSLVGPLSPLVLSLFGLGANELCDDRGLFAASAAGRAFEGSVEDALLHSGLPFDWVEGEASDEVLGRYRALILPCADIVDAALWPKLERYVRNGGTLLLGPVRPRWEPSGQALDVAALPAHELVANEVATLRALQELGVKAGPRFVEAPLIAARLRDESDQSGLACTKGGVLLVANETNRAVQSPLLGCVGGRCRFWDALSGTPLNEELTLKAGSVSLLRCRPVGVQEEGGSS
ncbi:MAG: beta-galactosidase [Deltaproteobacteria bacterium]|nr:beta-galactosidase [Deltaproteobacteria bacterium]